MSLRIRLQFQNVTSTFILETSKNLMENAKAAVECRSIPSLINEQEFVFVMSDGLTLYSSVDHFQKDDLVLFRTLKSIRNVSGMKSPDSSEILFQSFCKMLYEHGLAPLIEPSIQQCATLEVGEGTRFSYYQCRDSDEEGYPLPGAPPKTEHLDWSFGDKKEKLHVLFDHDDSKVQFWSGLAAMPTRVSFDGADTAILRASLAIKMLSGVKWSPYIHNTTKQQQQQKNFPAI